MRRTLKIATTRRFLVPIPCLLSPAIEVERFIRLSQYFFHYQKHLAPISILFATLSVVAVIRETRNKHFDAKFVCRLLCKLSQLCITVQLLTDSFIADLRTSILYVTAAQCGPITSVKWCGGKTDD